ncbi:hypothetical protein MMC25_002444 [Agyrium rufum]|nr:hypothetical protein [Agyrium rufum]
MPKTIIVTGASRGIGLAIATYICEEGHNVVVQARSKAPLEEFQAKYPKQVQILTGDMADFALAQKIADLTISSFGGIDGLVINHAVFPPSNRVEKTNPIDWKYHFDVNLISAVALCQVTIPEIRKAKGCIVMTSSGAAVKQTETWAAYGASKAALMHFGASVALEEPEICTVNVAPGVVDTAMQKELREVHSATMRKEDAARFIKLYESGDLLQPEVPGNVIARVVLKAPMELTGKFVRWNDPAMASFQEKA